MSESLTPTLTLNTSKASDRSLICPRSSRLLLKPRVDGTLSSCIPTHQTRAARRPRPSLQQSASGGIEELGQKRACESVWTSPATKAVETSLSLAPIHFRCTKLADTTVHPSPDLRDTNIASNLSLWHQYIFAPRKSMLPPYGVTRIRGILVKQC